MMQKQKFIAFAFILLASIAFPGCNLLPVDQNIQASHTPTKFQIATTTPTAEMAEQPETELTRSVLMDRVIIWVPPEFNPSGSNSGSLLQQQLDSFTQDHPGVEIDVRVKESNGPAGILSSLEKTLAIAPRVAPSLVLMTHNDLEIAAMRTLIQSPPSLQSMLEEDDWYDYARELALFQNKYYGLPFTADAMILAVRSNDIKPLTENWELFLSADHPLLFPAVDPQALFTVNLYLSAGGTLYDEQNKPYLDAEILKKVLEFYAAAVESGSILPNVMDYSNDEQVWIAFDEKSTDQAVCWMSDYFSQESPDVLGLIIPPLENEPVTIVSGWVWALADPFPERMELDLELMQHLTDVDFQAKWTASTGYLPVRPSSLPEGDNPVRTALLSQATISAVSQPSNEILSLLGPVLNEAVYDVIIKQAQPSEAARLAAEKINAD